ncbi:hypothetical protein ACH4TU_31590 [Streptomyces physcomitrii]|uniref:hypothetical protein n=1 Tax=Streptomyces physcomitrii TaxID=2724184 RepID=UPI0013316E43
MVEVAGLEMGSADDGQAHADGGSEHPGRHRDGLLVPGQGSLGVLQIAEDFSGVRGQASVVVDVDPRGFVAAGERDVVKRRNPPRADGGSSALVSQAPGLPDAKAAASR